MKKYFTNWQNSKLDNIWANSISSESEPLQQKFIEHEMFTNSQNISSSISVSTFHPMENEWKKHILSNGKIFIFRTAVLITLGFLSPHVALALDTNVTIAPEISPEIEEFFRKSPLTSLLLLAIDKQEKINEIIPGKKPGPQLIQGKNKIVPKTKYALLSKTSSGLAAFSSSLATRARKRSIRILFNSIAIIFSTLALASSIIDKGDGFFE